MHRMELHNTIGLPTAIRALEEKGYIVYKSGYETWPQELQDKIAANSVNNDRASIFLRWQPDLVGANNHRSALFEVKTNDISVRDTGNFAVESYSYIAQKMLQRGLVIYIFIDVNGGNVTAIYWAQELHPSRVFIPSRYNFEDKKDELAKYFPKDVIFSPFGHTNGSGTPFFLIPKNSDYIMRCGNV